MRQSFKLPARPLEKFLRLKRDFITIQDDQTYRRVTARWHGQGVILRDEVEGWRVKMRKQQVVCEGDLLVAEIDAKEGGFGIVPKELAGAIVTSHYFIYQVDINQLDLQYLSYYLRCGNPEQQIQRYVKGTTNYASIRPDDFLKIPILYPPLPLQRRIVNVLERAEELRRKRAEADALATEILPATFIEMFGDPTSNTKGLPTTLLTEVADIDPGYKLSDFNLSINGLVAFVPMANVDETEGAIREYELKPIRLLKGGKSRFAVSDILFAKITPSVENGKVALVEQPPSSLGFGSTEFFVIHPKQNGYLEYLWVLLRLDQVRGLAASSMTGTTGRKRVPRAFLEALRIPIPPSDDLQRFSDFVRNIRAASSRRKQSRQLLDSLYEGLLSRAFTGELFGGRTLAELLELTERQDILLALLAKAQEARDEPVNITPLMKYTFLLQMEETQSEKSKDKTAGEEQAEYEVHTTTKTLYDFVPYKYGPFAKEVYDDLDALANVGLVTISEMPREDGALREKTEVALLPEMKDAITELIETLPQNILAAADAVIQKYGSLTVNQLLNLVYERYPEFTVRSER